jgi:hypothetical protein
VDEWRAAIHKLFKPVEGNNTKHYSGFQIDATWIFKICFAVLCAFAPLREPFSRKGAKAQSTAKVAFTCNSL